MSASTRKFGFELEYASGAAEMVTDLHRQGLMQTDFLHDYHCTCPACQFENLPGTFIPPRNHICGNHCMDYGCWLDQFHSCGRTNCPRRNRQYFTDGDEPPADLRAQRDSTANGEFITRPLTDWDDLHRITEALTAAATRAGATTSSRCGLHVHVDTSDDLTMDGPGNSYGEPTGRELRLQRRRTVPAAYLAFERYFTEIVAPGASERKRAMNQTLMEACRAYVADGYGHNSADSWLDMGRGTVDDFLAGVIARDRHVDLNWSRRHSTWEFRAFNATNAPWRIELACRMAVAFVEAAPQLRLAVESTVKGSKFWPQECDSPWGEIVRPAFRELPTSHPTKKPVVPITQFIDILCAVDPDLRPLIERQASYMRTRYATEVAVAV